MDITVAICTWNRADLLRQTLQRLTEITVPTGVAWELLVVDNNCTDDTPAVIRSFRDRLPLTSVFEPQPGLSNARNAAVRAARGTHIIWTDDDVLVAENWVEAYASAFRNHPQAAVFGGPIEPLFAGDPPAWLRDYWRQVADVYAVRDFGDATLPLTHDRVPFGANYAIRAAEQRTHLYDPNLGRKGRDMISGEETTVVRAILASGRTGWWVPAARVQHYVPQERQNETYLRSFHEGIGRFIAQRSLQDGSFKPTDRLYAATRMWLARFSFPITRRVCSPRRWLEDLHIAAHYKGRLDGYRAGRITNDSHSGR